MRKVKKWLLIFLLLLLPACNLFVQRGTPIPDENTVTLSPSQEDPATSTPITPDETPPIEERGTKDLTERPQIWFGPLDPWSWDRYFPGQGPFQYYDLFTPDAAWQRASEAVHVVRLYPVWLDTYATPSQIEKVLSDIQRRGIAISYEAGPLTEHDNCNAATIEGFWGVPGAENIVRRIADAGGILYAMDLEHGFDAATYADPACRMSPVQIAEDTAKTIAAVRQVFPGVKVGSIETADLDAEAVAAWLTAYREVMGQELDYFHLDINFHRPDWAERSKAIEDYVRSRGVDFGIIYFGNVEDSSDAEWLARAEERFVEYEVIAGGNPDHVIFQSWHTHPQKLIPESDSDAFTNLILRYLRPRTSLTIDLEDQNVGGTLMDQEGQPVINASVEIQARPAEGEGLYTELVIMGNVPEEAKWADTGFRINTECDCRGSAEFVLERIDYQDGGQGTVPNGQFSSGLDGWGIWGSGSATMVADSSGSGSALAVSVSPEQELGMNSSGFPVMPGSPFSVTFGVKISPISVNSGYFDIIFLNDDGEVRRLTTPIRPVPAQLGQATTGPNGQYNLALQNLPSGAFDLNAWYPGNDDYWPAKAQLVPSR